MLHVYWQAPLLWSTGGEYALLAFRRLVDSGVEAVLKMNGSGPDQARLWFTRADLELTAAVEFGATGTFRRQPAADRVDAFLVTALGDAHLDWVRRGMRRGWPIVCSDRPAYRSLVKDRVTALMVDVRDPDMIAAALAELAFDPQLGARLGAAARAALAKDELIRPR